MIGFVDRGVLAVRLPFDQMVSVWELLMPLMFENLCDAKRPMKNLINQSGGDVRLPLNSGARADIPGPPLWATTRHLGPPKNGAGIS